MSLRALLSHDGDAGSLSPDRHQDSARDCGPPVEFHRWPLPGYVWAALERCYHSIFCSEPLLRLHGSINSEIEAWVARRNGVIICLILFERRFGCAQVVNQVFELQGEHLRQFAQALFARYPVLTGIRLRAVALRSRPVRYPCIVSPFSDDYVLALPATEDEWLASLSAQTREKLRYHWRRAQRHQPSMQFRTLSTGQIRAEQLHKILEYSRARMAAKGKRYGMNIAEERSLCALMMERGQLSVIEIDGQISAGLLCTCAGDDVMMHVIAHDPVHDDLRLGFLCCAMTIKHAIAQGKRRFHFLWGQYDYKIRLGGERTELSQVLLLRAYWYVLLHPRWVAEQARHFMRMIIRDMRRRLTARRS